MEIDIKHASLTRAKDRLKEFYFTTIFGAHTAVPFDETKHRSYGAAEVVIRIRFTWHADKWLVSAYAAKGAATKRADTAGGTLAMTAADRGSPASCCPVHSREDL